MTSICDLPTSIQEQIRTHARQLFEYGQLKEGY